MAFSFCNIHSHRLFCLSLDCLFHTCFLSVTPSPNFLLSLYTKIILSVSRVLFSSPANLPASLLPPHFSPPHSVLLLHSSLLPPSFFLFLATLFRAQLCVLVMISVPLCSHIACFFLTCRKHTGFPNFSLWTAVMA